MQPGIHGTPTFPLARDREVEQGGAEVQQGAPPREAVAQAARAGQRLLTGYWLGEHLGTAATACPAPAGTRRKTRRGNSHPPGRRRRGGSAAAGPSPAPLPSPPSGPRGGPTSWTLWGSRRCLVPPPTRGPMEHVSSSHVGVAPAANGRARRRAKGRPAAQVDAGHARSLPPFLQCRE